MKEVVSVFPSRTFQLQTTRSWEFMGLNEKVSQNSVVESDIIVGVIDTGIWPESESFKDDGFGPPPKSWKGVCDGGKNFNCNNKLIGSRRYTAESARDELGHGTHTASTVAGNAVKDVNFYGLANVSKGTVEAGIDDDPVAIGAFHAMKNGILTSQPAGNMGLKVAFVVSVAPWILTVAASSMDHRFTDKVVLANGKTLVGKCVNTFTLNGTSFPLIYGKDAGTKNCTGEDAGDCEEGCLDGDSVKGKIVLCDSLAGDRGAYKAGALGSVLMNEV